MCHKKSAFAIKRKMIKSYFKEKQDQNRDGRKNEKTWEEKDFGAV